MRREYWRDRVWAIIALAVASIFVFACSGADEASSASDSDEGNKSAIMCRSDRDCSGGLRCKEGECVAAGEEFGDDDAAGGDGGAEELCPPTCELANAGSHCDDPFAGCVIDECNIGFYDLDGDAENGCEYECAVTHEGTELCDGRDNNCNGEIDETDVDKVATKEWWEAAGIKTDINNCGRCGEKCEAGSNGVPICVAGQCKIECDAGYTAIDADDPMKGCQKAVTCSKTNGGVEICDGLDNDCNGVIDEQTRDNGEKICIVGYECRDGEDGRQCYKIEGTGGCARDCRGKECGSDGCGGECGYCYVDEICNANYQCEPADICAPDCMDKRCGDDGCGGECGVCAGAEVCVNGECVGSFLAQHLQMNMTYTPAVIAKRNAFLAFRSGDGGDPYCSETGTNKGGENGIYPDAEKEPNWAEQGFPKYNYLGGHEDKIEWKSISNGDGEYEIRVGLASRCLNELPYVGCTEDSDINTTVAMRIANSEYKYLCYRLTKEGEDVPLARIRVVFGRIEVNPMPGVPMYEMKGQAQSDKKNCFIK